MILVDAIDCACGDEIHPKRAELGYRTCLKCGDKVAARQSAIKAKSVVTLHKSNSVYLGTGAAARQYAKDVAHMRRGVNE